MLSHATLSKAGGRPNNEDCVGVWESGGRVLFALADGLGGHGGGEIASSLAVSKATEAFEAGAKLAQCFLLGQNALIDEQRRRGTPGEIKTTLVLLLADDDIVHWGHIGDSRLYVFDKSKFVSRTKDHSVPQMLLNAGDIRERDIRFHPDRNRLLRVMGIEWDTPRYELSEPCPLESGTSYLLCTDGFWELIDEKDMCRALKAAQNPQEWLDDMEDTVLRNGRGKSMDNYSAVAVWIR